MICQNHQYDPARTVVCPYCIIEDLNAKMINLSTANSRLEMEKTDLLNIMDGKELRASNEL